MLNIKELIKQAELIVSGLKRIEKLGKENHVIERMLVDQTQNLWAELRKLNIETNKQRTDYINKHIDKIADSVAEEIVDSYKKQLQKEARKVDWIQEIKDNNLTDIKDIKTHIWEYLY